VVVVVWWRRRGGRAGIDRVRALAQVGPFMLDMQPSRLARNSRAR
jgi:hypothetical protein